MYNQWNLTYFGLINFISDMPCILCWRLWCLTPISTIFQIYRGGQFIGGGKLTYSKKIADLA